MSPGTESSVMATGCSSERELHWWSRIDQSIVRNYRRTMLKILGTLLLRQVKEEKQRLPLIARRLEEQLLKASGSLEAYMDKTTLKDRLRTIAKQAKLHRSSKALLKTVPKTTTRITTTPSSSQPHDTVTKKAHSPVSLLDIMDKPAVERHIQSVKSDVVRERGLRALETATKHHKFAWLFADPVDPVKLNLVDYFQVIKKPMDLGTIRKRLEQLEYCDLEDVLRDTQLTFSNAILYNGKDSEVGRAALELNEAIKASLENEMKDFANDDPKCDNRCRLCHRGRLALTPLAYRCDGPGCEGQRIRRGAPSFFDPVGRRRFCRTCLDRQGLDMNTFIREKAGDDDDAEEPWVQCSRCDSWVHQVCALFNGRANTSDLEYICPHCWKESDSITKAADDHFVAADDASLGKIKKNDIKWLVSDLPTTPLSNELEIRLATVWQASVKALDTDDKKKQPHLRVREVSDAYEQHSIKPRFMEHVKPAIATIQTRNRCIALFQNIDGVDVFLLCMYVYEYEEPGINERKLYLSYLDSVSYLRPKQTRTSIYHELLVGYLADARRRGFHTAHIWACPPKRGDDYIFNVKPKHQRTPSDDRLRKWYNTALENAKSQGIVSNITTFWEDILAPLVSETDASNDDQALATLPYFEGDWWCAEVERLLEADAKAKEAAEAEAARADDDDTGYASTKTGTPRSSGTSSRQPPKKKRKKLTSARQRAVIEPPTVISRLAKTMQLMKDSFLVAHLQPLEESVAESSPESAGELEIKHEDVSDEEDMGTKNSAASPDTDSIQRCKMEMVGNPADEQKDEDEAEPAVTSLDTKTSRSDILRSRQHFLDVCQGNHYQFDELRRAKHATMMVLYHMHNPEAPLFPSSCSRCGVEIGDGARSPTHAICRSCQSKIHSEPRGVRVRRLSSRAAEAAADQASGRPLPPIVLPRGTASGTRSASMLTAQQQQQQTPAPEAKERADKARLLESLLRLLDHATTCVKDHGECTVPQCSRMKQQILHLKQCRIPNRQVDCRDCRRIYTLLQLHARSCRRAQCPVLLCDAFKKRVAQATNSMAATATTQVSDAQSTPSTI